MAQAAVAPLTLLTIPFEIRTRIYKEVFAGSEMHLKSVGKGRVRCTNPEHYRFLRTCKQIKEEGSIILAALTILYVKANENPKDKPRDVLQCCHSRHAPRFLRQSVQNLRKLKLELYADNFATLVRSLVPFVQLREARISAGRSMNDCIPDSILACPLLLLGTASDKLFVMTLKRCLTKVALDHTNRAYVGTKAVSCSSRPFKAMVNEPLDDLHEVIDPKARYDMLWEGRCELQLESSIWLPWAQSPRAFFYLRMKYVANLGANTILSKTFSMSGLNGWTEDPQQLLGWIQDATRSYWPAGAVARTTLPE